MSKMQKTAEILGIESNKPFGVNENDEEYIIDENGLRLNESGKPYMPLTLGLLLQGQLTVRQKPWKPKDNETVWCCDRFGGQYSVCFRARSGWDLLYWSNGLYFPTEKDAIAHKDEVLKKYEELKRYYEEA